jgi:hypothetical protein
LIFVTLSSVILVIRHAPAYPTIDTTIGNTPRSSACNGCQSCSAFRIAQ